MRLLSMIRPLACWLVVASVMGLFSAPSYGYNEFQKVFLATYAGRENPEFRKVARKAKCFVCHQGKEDRGNCNLYGEAIRPHLGKEDKKDKAKIAEVLAKIAEALIDEEDKSAGTFGDRIEAGELPGGPLEDSKKEPADSEDIKDALR